MRKEDFMVRWFYSADGFILEDGFLLDFLDGSIMLESFLIVLGVIFLSIVGYYFFVFSTRDDRAEKKLEHYSNPWDKVSGQTETQPPKTDHRQKLKVVLFAAMVVLAILILFLLVILWGRNK